MRTFLFLLLTTPIFSQAKSIDIEGIEHIALTVPDASIVDYWGRKGVASVPEIQTLELEIKLLGQKIEFKDFIIDNQRKSQEEYRDMLARSAAESNRLLAENISLREDRDKYREKARKRGEKLWAIGGIAGFGLATFLIGKF